MVCMGVYNTRLSITDHARLALGEDARVSTRWQHGSVAARLGGSAARWQRGSVAVRLGGSAALWQRGSVAARLGGSAARWQRGSVAARLGDSATRPSPKIMAYVAAA